MATLKIHLRARHRKALKNMGLALLFGLIGFGCFYLGQGIEGLNLFSMMAKHLLIMGGVFLVLTTSIAFLNIVRGVFRRSGTESGGF